MFADVPGVRIFGEEDGASGSSDQDNHWLTAILVDPKRAGWSVAELMCYLSDHDIEARPLWKPMHLQPAFAPSDSYLNGTSERLFSTGLALPSGSALTPEEVSRVSQAVATFLEGRRSR
jgi:dTDP-4-amino-4,6-dideoxygalactose transaminase